MKTILCIEGQERQLQELKAAVEDAGYEALTAATAQQALDVFATRPVDGVLLDCRLPDLNGATVRRRLTHIKPDVPVLMFDGRANDFSTGLRCIEAYIQQPDPPDSLLSRVAGAAHKLPRTNG